MRKGNDFTEQIILRQLLKLLSKRKKAYKSFVIWVNARAYIKLLNGYKHIAIMLYALAFLFWLVLMPVYKTLKLNI